MRVIQFVFLLIFCCGFGASAQSPKSATGDKPATLPRRTIEPPKRMPAEIAEFFQGQWAGSGEFANGKKIEADASFKLDLDNQWLVYRHTDRAPNQYKALGLWGFESSSGKFVMILSDNFGGVRLFLSDGWSNGKIVFRKSAPLLPTSNPVSDKPSRQEQFTFERQPDGTLKMSYEASLDGMTWKLGDYVVFKKKS